jgi:cytochrome c biogenesis protein CcmG/thiol:disulfide interchange protein DsbE
MIQTIYIRAACCGFMVCGLATSAPAPSAQDVLNQVSAAYSHATALHVVAKRDELWIKDGRSVLGNSELEIALRGGRKYLVRVKVDGQESLAMSDGERAWKALPSKKQWMQLAAAALDANGGEDGPDPRSRDLYSSLSNTLAGRYVALAKLAENPEIAGEEEVKVGGQKIPCYVLRVRTGGMQHELWIDQQRFVVLQHKEKGEANGMHADIRLKVSALEINSPPADSTFQFEPGKGWSEAEMLLLPGEERMLLTGSRAANFSLKTLEGEPVVLDETRGKVVVLDFWATWCPPCREELPSIVKLRDEFAGRVQFYGINDEDSGTVKDFLRKHTYEIAVLMDGKRQVHRQYGVSSIPTLLIIDKDGVIREHFIGSRSEAKLRQAIQAVAAAN